MQSKTSLFFLSSLIFIDTQNAYIISSPLVSNNRLTWKDAEHHCIDKYNTHLASIHSQSDWKSVVTLISDFEANFWVGLNINISSSSSYPIWSDGTNINIIHNISQIIYQLNRMNNSYIEKNNYCVTLQWNHKYHWNISDCNHKYFAICNGNNSKLYSDIFNSTEDNNDIFIREEKIDVMQLILDNEWLVFGLSLLIGFLCIGIVYCLIVVLCVSYLNVQTLSSNKIHKNNEDNIDVDITITQHYNNELMVQEEGHILTKKHKFKYKQRTLKLPKSPRSKTKSPQSYNKSIQTSLNVRYPDSARSRISCTEDVALITEGSHTLKDIMSTIDALDTSTEYFTNIDNGRMTVGDHDMGSPSNEQNCFSKEEMMIKENICSIEMNLKIMQNMDDINDDTSFIHSDTESYSLM